MRLAFWILIVLAALGGCRRHKGPIGPAPQGSLEQRVDEQARAREPSAQRAGDVYRGVAQDEDEGGSWPVALERGQCYWFSAAGDAQVEEILVALFEPADDDRVESEKESPGAVMTYCPTETRTYRLEVTVTEGRGHFAVGVFTKGEGLAGAAGPIDLGAAADARAAEVAPDATRPQPHFEGEPPQGDWYLELVPGTCYWFAGVGDEAITKLSLELWSPKEERVAFDAGAGGRALIEHCAAVGGMFHLQAKLEGAGRFVVGQYERAAPSAHLTGASPNAI
jgi:hypothetical protein